VTKRTHSGHRGSRNDALGEVRGKFFRFRFGDLGHRRIGFKRGNLIRDGRPLCNWFLHGKFRRRDGFRLYRNRLANGFKERSRLHDGLRNFGDWRCNFFDWRGNFFDRRRNRFGWLRNFEYRRSRFECDRRPDRLWREGRPDWLLRRNRFCT
jgi:hypothetical protein